MSLFVAAISWCSSEKILISVSVRLRDWFWDKSGEKSFGPWILCCDTSRAHAHMRRCCVFRCHGVTEAQLPSVYKGSAVTPGGVTAHLALCVLPLGYCPVFAWDLGDSGVSFLVVL